MHTQVLFIVYHISLWRNEKIRQRNTLMEIEFRSCEYQNQWTIACQVLLSVGFPGKNTGVGIHSLQGMDQTQTRIKPRSPALQADSLPSDPPEKPLEFHSCEYQKQKYFFTSKISFPDFFTNLRTYIPSSAKGLRELHTFLLFLPGESHGQRSLVGYSPWGCKELDMTERWSTHTLAPDLSQQYRL